MVGFGSRPARELLAARTPAVGTRASADIVRHRARRGRLPAGPHRREKKTATFEDQLPGVSARPGQGRPAVADFYQARTHGEWGSRHRRRVRRSMLGRSDLPRVSGHEAAARFDPTHGLYAFRLPGHGRLGRRCTFPTATPRSRGCWCAASFPMRCRAASAEDVVTAHVDYARLDRSATPVRVRLSSTVTRVQPRRRSRKRARGGGDAICAAAGRSRCARAAACSPAGT